MKAVICPVCNGVGQVSAGFYSRGGDCQYWVTSGLGFEMCRSCNGKGWVEVAEGIQFMYSAEPIIPLEAYPGIQPPEPWPVESS